MNIIYLLIPLALFLVFVFVALYLWAVRRGQFDDLDTPAHRMLLEDTPQSNSRNPNDNNSTHGTAPTP
ncbi:cbb3-type cytochrome oxidase assembly protein CcoS [bacterium]|nr:cbb3-type cytochrome oxidase assembly protein CcoS [bacterium]MBU1984396.1 cbb3-type cytochrome oxidase assembly protein CcoS [bacterium]